MSTKQTVIFTFMIIFLAVMLYSMGAYFHLSSELDAKNRTLEVLDEQKIVLNRIIDGTAVVAGLRSQMKDPIKGLEKQLSDESNRAQTTEKDARERQALYEGREKELDQKWPVAQAKWKTLFEDWSKHEGNIKAALVQLNKKIALKEQSIATAQIELEQELKNEDTERMKAVNERKEYATTLSQSHFEHEDILDKVASVTRDASKSKTIVSQGKIVHAADDLHTVTIDLGSMQGVQKGMQFAVYSGAHSVLVKKGDIKILKVNSSSSLAIILPSQRIVKVDPVTGWESSDPQVRFSVFATDDHGNSIDMQKPVTKADRIEALRIQKIKDEQGLESAEAARANKTEVNAPVVELGRGFVPLMAGDWICNPDFIPIVPDGVFQKNTVAELMEMQDINISSLTFYFSDGILPYRKESLKRLCERNMCKTTDAMSADVGYIVTPSGAMNLDVMLQTLLSDKDRKEIYSSSGAIKPAVLTEKLAAANVKDDQTKMLLTLVEGRRLGAQVLFDDDLESFFARRQRKMELLRGTTIQPGQHTFYIAGETRERSAEELRRYILDHGGVVMTELNSKVDYVVAGSGLESIVFEEGSRKKTFFEKVKELGLKVIREEELPRFFGIE